MLGLILYCILVAIGTVVLTALGLVVEREFSATLSLIVFLALFFLDFGVAWYATVWIVDRRGRRRHRECPQCKGAGIARDNRQCVLCNGTGRVELETEPAFAARWRASGEFLSGRPARPPVARGSA